MEKAEILRSLSVFELVDELQRRSGVDSINLPPHDKVSCTFDGPAVVLKIIN